MTRRVLHVVASLSSADGVSVATKTMLRGLSERSDWSTTAIVGIFPWSDHEFEVPGVEMIELVGYQPFGGRLGPSAAYPPGFVSRVTEALAVADVVHLHSVWLYPTLVGARIARRRKVPYIVSPHGSLMPLALRQKSWKKKLVLALWERANLNKAARVVAASDPEADALVRLGLQSPVVVIPYALSQGAAEYFRSHHDSPRQRDPGRRVLLTVSRYHRAKRLLELIEVFAGMAQEFPDWHLTIVGSAHDTEYRAAVLRAAGRDSLAGRISVVEDLTGPGLWELYRISELFVLPSITENFGLVVIESLAAGIPVIATTGSPWRELESASCGWWTDTSLEALRSALHRAMSMDGQTLAVMGAKGTAFVSRRYVASAQAAALSRLYEDVARSSMSARLRAGS